MQIFIAPGVLDAPTCRRVQAAMDAGTPEEAEVLDEGFALQEDVRRATQIDVADTVLTMLETSLDAMRVPIASFYGLTLQSREGASVLRYETGGFYRPHVDRAHVPYLMVASCGSFQTRAIRSTSCRRAARSSHSRPPCFTR
jgi:predicted 2-oxoglutarate/Fe(II)-dependent dioxygenase YbiX